MERGLLEIILNRVDDGLSISDRRKLKLLGRPASTREFLRAVVADAAAKYREEVPEAPAFAAGVSEDRETPILDFLRELIEQGKIQPFLEWLFEALPKLIAAIVAIFAVI